MNVGFCAGKISFLLIQKTCLTFLATGEKQSMYSIKIHIDCVMSFSGSGSACHKKHSEEKREGFWFKMKTAKSK